VDRNWHFYLITCHCAGFEYITQGCYMDQGKPPCSDPQKHMFWDLYHSTQNSNKYMANWIIQDIVSKFGCKWWMKFQVPKRNFLMVAHCVSILFCFPARMSWTIMYVNWYQFLINLLGLLTQQNDLDHGMLWCVKPLYTHTKSFFI